MQANLSILTPSEENRILITKNDKCDKLDYLIAAGCGVIGALIDVFLVGSPKNSALGTWTDSQVNSVVVSFAKLMGWKPSGSCNTSTAIEFLQRKFPVNYDQATSMAVPGVENMSASNHHMMSIAHSPSPIGLFFSIINQFTSTSSFISNGKIVTVNTETFELRGNNFFSKLICGFVNWLGHLMSDVAGSSSSSRVSNRGSGIVIPFYELFGLCKLGRFGNEKQDLAQIATKAFEQGYDFRFGLAMGIPVAITEFTIRLIWMIRRHFQYGYPIRDCIPTANHPTLRMMLIVGNGTLCVIDGLDAAIRSGGNMVNFFLRLNLIAWFRLITLILKEIFFRLKIGLSLQKTIDSYKRVNQAMTEYLQQLEKIDIEAFKKETNSYNKLIANFEKAETPEQLNVMLLDIYSELGLKKPWEGDFSDFMKKKDTTFVFE